MYQCPKCRYRCPDVGRMSRHIVRHDVKKPLTGNLQERKEPSETQETEQ